MFNIGGSGVSCLRAEIVCVCVVVWSVGACAVGSEVSRGSD